MNENAMSLPDLRTEVLEQLQLDGSDTSKPHGFDFYLYFPSESAAEQASHQLSAGGFRVKVAPAATGANWLCLAKIIIVPDVAPLAEMGARFKQLAQDFRGEFDGWESDVALS